MDDQERITYFGETDFRNQRTRFGIRAKDRTRHMYVIGKTGMGKSTLLENMAIQDIQNGEGLAFMDPHGGTAEKLLDYVPEHRIKDVVYFAPFDTEFPISFNVMEDVGADKRHLVVNGLMATFEKIWADAWSARMAYILQNTLLALLEYPGSTLLGVNRMYVDKDFRKKVVDNIQDAAVKSFWVDEYAKYTDRYAQEATPAIQNKIGQFASNPLIRNIIGQAKSSFDIRTMMDQKKILIINLSKGRVGEGNARLLGSMLITKIYLAAMSRADLSANDLSRSPNFYLYVDEFQSFANKSFADILSEARKYKLNLTIAHQYVEQMEEEVRDAVFGNVGTMVTFRVGSYDAEIFEKEFAPQFTAEDIVNLGQFQMYLRLMINQVGSKPFSARAMAPIAAPERSFKQEIIDWSRSHNARARAETEKEITDWHAPIAPPPRPPSAVANDLRAKVINKPAVRELKTESPKPAPQPFVLPKQAIEKTVPKTNFPLRKQLQEVPGAMEQKIIPQPKPQPTAPQKLIPKSSIPPKKPSPAMQQLLSQLEEKVEIPAPVEKKEIPLSALKTYPPKDARPESMNALKEALAKAGAASQVKSTQPVASSAISQQSQEKPLVHKKVFKRGSNPQAVIRDQKRNEEVSPDTLQDFLQQE